MKAADRAFVAACTFLAISHVKEGAVALLYTAFAVCFWALCLKWDRR